MANPKRTEKQWRKLVSQWERSGLSAGEFAATRSNLHPRTLTWWASKLRRDAREQQSATNDEGFLTVVVVPPENPVCRENSRTSANPTVSRTRCS